MDEQNPLVKWLVSQLQNVEIDTIGLLNDPELFPLVLKALALVAKHTKEKVRT